MLSWQYWKPWNTSMVQASWGWGWVFFIRTHCSFSKLAGSLWQELRITCHIDYSPSWKAGRRHQHSTGIPCHTGSCSSTSPACSDDCHQFYRCKKYIIQPLLILIFNMLNISCFKRDKPFQLWLSFLRTARNSCKTMLSLSFSLPRFNKLF